VDEIQPAEAAFPVIAGCVTPLQQFQTRLQPALNDEMRMMSLKKYEQYKFRLAELIRFARAVDSRYEKGFEQRWRTHAEDCAHAGGDWSLLGTILPRAFKRV